MQVRLRAINDQPPIRALQPMPKQSHPKLNSINALTQATMIPTPNNRRSRRRRQRRPNHLSRIKRSKQRPCRPARRAHQKTTWRPITMAMQRPSHRRVANHRAPPQTQSDPTTRSTTPATRPQHQTHPIRTNISVLRIRPSQRQLLPLQLLPSLISIRYPTNTQVIRFLTTITHRRYLGTGSIIIPHTDYHIWSTVRLQSKRLRQPSSTKT